MKRETKKEMYQIVILTLSDGTTWNATGVARFYPDKINPAIVKTQFLEPQELPEGMSFENIK